MRVAPLTAALLSLIVLPAIPLLVGRLRRLPERARGVALSLAGGVGVAYVFVDLLPQLAEQRYVLAVGGPIAFEGKTSVLALLGILVFMLAEQLVSPHHETVMENHENRSTIPLAVYSLHALVFGVYSGLIGYLVVERFQNGPGAVLFLIAMSLHLLVSDAGLRRLHPRRYSRVTRWGLALITATGVLLGATQAVSAWGVAALTAFLAGGIILNTLKEEVPGAEERNFVAFSLGAIGYALLLLAT